MSDQYKKATVEDGAESILIIEGLEHEKMLLSKIDERELITSIEGFGYSLTDIISNAINQKIKYHILLDRNICSYINELAKGERLNNAALDSCIALLAYAQIGNIICEPAIAYHEYANSANFESVKMDLINFRKADNLHFSHYIRYLKKQESIGNLSKKVRENRVSIPDDLSEESTRKKPIVFRHNFLPLKKASIYALRGHDPHTIIKNVLEWMHTDFLFSGPAITWLIQNFTVHKIEKRRKEISFSQIENWSLDLALIQHCIGLNLKFNETGEFYFLASNDKTLRKTYKFIARGGKPDQNKELQSLVHDCWGNTKQAKIILDTYSELASRQFDPSRKKSTGISLEYLTSLENDIDNELANLLNR